MMIMPDFFNLKRKNLQYLTCRNIVHIEGSREKSLSLKMIIFVWIFDSARSPTLRKRTARNVKPIFSRFNLILLFFALKMQYFLGFQTSQWMKKGPIHQNCGKWISISNKPENVNFGQKLTFLIQKNQFSEKYV